MAGEVKFITYLIDFGSAPSYGRKLFRLPAGTFAEVTSHYANSYVGANLIATRLRGKAFTMTAMIEELPVETFRQSSQLDFEHEGIKEALTE